MFTSKHRMVLGALATVAITSQMFTPVFSQNYNGVPYRAYASRQTTGTKVKSYFAQHPKVKAATVGAGVGTAAGAVTGLVSGRGVVRGALIGAGTGTGVGLIRSSRTMKRHPLIRDTATGVATGLGVGLASSRSGKTGLKGAAVGGAVGLGIGAISRYVR